MENKPQNDDSAKGKGGKKSKSKNDAESDKSVFAVPVNNKLPWFNIKEIPDEYYKDIEEGRKIQHRYYVFKFSEWAKQYKKPLCKITESIGEAGNLEAESMRLLRMHDICTEAYEDENCEPTASVHECLKMFSKDIDPETKEWIIPDEEIKKRLDLREKRIFTIDPITAKDLDDALSIEQITDDIFEIGVHIADVSYFVQ